MPAEQWIDWPADQCPECGGSLEVLTCCPQSRSEIAGPSGNDDPGSDPPYCYSEDRWRCEDGHGGRTYTDGESAMTFDYSPQA